MSRCEASSSTRTTRRRWSPGCASSGYDARAERERLAGEDDDEDHPWAVLTDAPELVLELLVDEYDGWLDVADPSVVEPVGPHPSSCPTEPRKIKRPPALTCRRGPPLVAFVPHPSLGSPHAR